MSTSPWDDALRRYATATHHVDGADTVIESDVAATGDEPVAATGAVLPSFDSIVGGDGMDLGKTESLVVPSSLDEVLHDAGVEQELPVPAQTYEDAPVSPEPVEATDDVLTHEWDVVNADSDQGSNTWEVNTEDYRISTMSVARMAPGSVFIPESGIYLELQPSDTFEASNYGDLQTIHVPTNVHRGVWYSAGASLTASDTGVLTGVRSGFDAPQSSALPSSAPSSDTLLCDSVVDQNIILFFSEGHVLIEPVTERIGRMRVVREDGGLGSLRNRRRGGNRLRSLSSAVLRILLGGASGETCSRHLALFIHLNVIDDVLGDVVGFSGIGIRVHIGSRVVHDGHQVTLMNHVKDTVSTVVGDEALDRHRIGAALAVSLGEVLVGQNGEANRTRTVLVGEETRIRGQATLDNSEVLGVDVCHFCFLLRMARVRSL